MAPPLKSNATFDVVVVGGGSSGCVIAARLSEDRSRRVLLVESGNDFPNPGEVPEAIQRGYDSAVTDHLFQYDGYLHRDQRVPTKIPRGKVIGGSGAVNGALFFHGLPEDYDSWASDLWTYDAILPFLRKLEHDLDFKDDFHGSDGPVPVLRTPEHAWIPYQRAFREAILNLGIAEKPDLNSPTGQGFGAAPLNMVDGVRLSAAKAYLDPIRSRSNLEVWGDTEALKVELHNGRATGVELCKGGNRVQVSAGEIVLSAGAIATPELLMHSGIGSAESLQALGITVRLDLPGVGKNARDHPSVLVETRLPAHLRPQSDGPRIEGFLVHSSTGGSRNDLHVFPSFLLPADVDPTSANAIAIERAHVYVILERSLSSGELQLITSDRSVRPIIHFRYLEEELDRERLREGVRLTTAALTDPVMGDATESAGAPSRAVLENDRELDRWILDNLATCKHTSGTCRIGPSDDPLAVVNERGAVHGLGNLTVADLSICPDIVSAPTNCTAMLIGERVASFFDTARNLG
jgi:choline dehydrogenase